MTRLQRWLLAGTVLQALQLGVVESAFAQPMTPEQEMLLKKKQQQGQPPPPPPPVQMKAPPPPPPPPPVQMKAPPPPPPPPPVQMKAPPPPPPPVQQQFKAPPPPPPPVQMKAPPPPPPPVQMKAPPPPPPPVQQQFKAPPPPPPPPPPPVVQPLKAPPPPVLQQQNPPPGQVPPPVVQPLKAPPPPVLQQQNPPPGQVPPPVVQPLKAPPPPVLQQQNPPPGQVPPPVVQPLKAPPPPVLQQQNPPPGQVQVPPPPTLPPKVPADAKNPLDANSALQKEVNGLGAGGNPVVDQTKPIPAPGKGPGQIGSAISVVKNPDGSMTQTEVLPDGTVKKTVIPAPVGGKPGVPPVIGGPGNPVVDPTKGGTVAPPVNAFGPGKDPGLRPNPVVNPIKVVRNPDGSVTQSETLPDGSVKQTVIPPKGGGFADPAKGAGGTPVLVPDVTKAPPVLGAVPLNPQLPPPQQPQKGKKPGGKDMAIGAAAGFVGGFLAGQAIGNLNGVQNQRQVVDQNGIQYIQEPGRTIIRQGDQYTIYHDENERFRNLGIRMRQENRGGVNYSSYVAPGGVVIYTVTSSDGRLLKRYKRYPNGAEVVLIDNTFGGQYRPYDREVIMMPPPPVRMPRERYIVNDDEADEGVIYETFRAPPVAPVARRYSLDEVRNSQGLRSYMPSVDVNTVTFDTGSWEVSYDAANRLAVIAQAMKQTLQQNPNEVYLVEGHTDAVGAPEDNLSLSDRRAQSVAAVLTRNYGIPAENLTTQGYGEQYLKVQTEDAERANRRVTVRRITPLLTGQAGEAQPGQELQPGQQPVPQQ